MAAGDVAQAIAAIRAGEAVLLPADGVYGLCASAYREGPVRRLYALKGRGAGQPSAMIAASVEMLIECVPELRGRSELIVRTLLPGPFTLVLPNPARRYAWLAGGRPDTIGVRVARLPREAQRVLDAVGAVAATSAVASSGSPAPTRSTAGAGPLKSITVDGRPGRVPASSSAAQPARIAAGTSARRAGGGSPGSFALVAATAPTASRTRWASRGSRATRTPIVSGRPPASQA